LAAEAARLNEAFNHWIVHHTPFVTVKAAMTLDGKIATPTGESKWITGAKARAEGMRLRVGSDAILVGVNTILADDPSLTVRGVGGLRSGQQPARVRRIILDTRARTPLKAKVIRDASSALTTIVVGRDAPVRRTAALEAQVEIWRAPLRRGRIDLRWVLRRLGSLEVTSVLVEGGGEVNASFLLGGLTQRVVFFYAPKILGGRNAHKAVAGDGARTLKQTLSLRDVEWRRVGPDLMMTARVI
jgi:diaminohydroxyphosphoribosylaminopyrimidine deaminase/5-amino-6-(5-phosphoribosylamino)uracil reductase